MEVESEDQNLGIKILDKRIGEIPCFRDSYFYGICSGIFGGFGYFMFTSKVRRATHVGFGTYVVSTLAFWAYCRMKYNQDVREALQLKEFMLEQVAKEGTDTEPPDAVTL